MSNKFFWEPDNTVLKFIPMNECTTRDKRIIYNYCFEEGLTLWISKASYEVRKSKARRDYCWNKQKNNRIEKEVQKQS